MGRVRTEGLDPSQQLKRAHHAGPLLGELVSRCGMSLSNLWTLRRGVVFAAPVEVLEDAWDRIEEFCRRHVRRDAQKTGSIRRNGVRIKRGRAPWMAKSFTVRVALLYSIPSPFQEGLKGNPTGESVCCGDTYAQMGVGA